MVSDVMLDFKKPFSIYTNICLLQYADLYFGGDKDPIEMANLDACDRLAYDNEGNKLPYSISVSIFGQDINREIQLLEDVGEVSKEQKIAVHVIVFGCIEDYYLYEYSNETIIS